LDGLQVQTVDEKLRRFKSLATTCNKNEQHQDAKHMVNYRPNGRRKLWRPLKRLLNEAETSLWRPNLWRMMIMMRLNVRFFKGNMRLKVIILEWG